MLVGILVPIAFFATAFGIVYVLVTARNKERLSLIEKGVDAEIFYKKSGRTYGKYISLQFGLLVVGIAIGIVLGAVLENAGLEEEPAYFSMIMLFGGLGLLVYYMIMRRIKPENGEEQ